jgi:hypothetical protein
MHAGVRTWIASHMRRGMPAPCGVSSRARHWPACVMWWSPSRCASEQSPLKNHRPAQPSAAAAAPCTRAKESTSAPAVLLSPASPHPPNSSCQGAWKSRMRMMTQRFANGSQRNSLLPSCRSSWRRRKSQRVSPRYPAWIRSRCTVHRATTTTIKMSSERRKIQKRNHCGQPQSARPPTSGTRPLPH